MERTERLKTEPNLWLASVRKDGRPHLVPIWFVWLNGCFYICTARRSVKARNILTVPFVSVALENGTQPVVAECRAQALAPPYDPAVVQAFKDKFEWNILTDQEYDGLFELTPLKWLMG